MMVRTLPADELTKMHGAGGPLGEWLRTQPTGLDPDHTRVVVMEDATGAIKGYMVVFDCLHVEPLWFDDDVRRKVPKAGIEMIKRALGEAQNAGAQSVFGIILEADKATVAPLAAKMGFTPLPGQLYAIRFDYPEKVDS